jgi:hypothetical protein
VTGTYDHWKLKVSASNSRFSKLRDYSAEELTNLTDTKFDCLKMIQKLSYTGSVSLDFTLSEIYAEPSRYMSSIELSIQ